MKEQNRSVEFLNKVYENSTMGEESITMLSEKVEDTEMLTEMQYQHQEYSKITNNTVSALSKEKALPKDKNPLAQMGLWSGVQMNTMTDRSTDKIAEIMIEGSTMGIIDMARTLKQYPDIEPEYKAIGESLIKLEENSSQRMKSFLG